MKFLGSLMLSLFLHLAVQAQDCNCTISQVAQSTVVPCDLVIGNVFTVASVDEFYAAISQANSSGDVTILIEDGVYAVASTAQYPYLTGSNVVIRSASGNRDAVVLTGQGMSDVAPGTEIGIYAVGDNITIADLTIRNVGNHGIAVTGDNLFVHNVRIQDTFEQMIKGNSGGDGSENSIVQCSLFEYTAGIGPQFYIGGLDIHEGLSWVVRDNIFKDIASPSQSLAEHAVHFWDSSAENIVERNLMINCDRGVGFGLGASPNQGGIIRNNMIYNDGMHPFHDVGIGLETSPNTLVYHNTVIVAYQNAIEYRFPETFDVYIGNNLCNRPITSRNDGVADLESNIVNATADWFVDATGGDLHLNAPVATVMDQAVVLAEPIIDDHDKMARPSGAGNDIGAHEFQIADFTVEHFKPSFTLFPSPAHNSLSIAWEGGQFVNLSIYSVEGKIMLASEITPDQYTFQVDVSGWPSGVYFCTFQDAEPHVFFTKRFGVK